MSLGVDVLVGEVAVLALEDVARLRIAVFRDYPYLYDGSLDYERNYLSRFAAAPGALIVTVRDGDNIVGAATGCPLSAEHPEFTGPFAAAGHDVDGIFYCAESVLLPAYRGRGLGHEFFDRREKHGRNLGLAKSAFCAVVRPDTHTLRPKGFRPLDAFWQKRGYAPVDGLIARFSWRDIGDDEQTEKPLQVWMKDL